MKPTNFSHEQTLEAEAASVFAAILDVRSWWSGRIEGHTDRVGAEFRYRYADQHDSTQRVAELVPNRKVVWRVIDSHLAFTEKPNEWTGTEIVFELVPVGNHTRLTFSHVGLRSSCECYGACSEGWTKLLANNLRNRVSTGLVQPDAFGQSG